MFECYTGTIWASNLCIQYLHESRRFTYRIHKGKSKVDIKVEGYRSLKVAFSYFMNRTEAGGKLNYHIEQHLRGPQFLSGEAAETLDVHQCSFVGILDECGFLCH